MGVVDHDGSFVVSGSDDEGAVTESPLQIQRCAGLELYVFTNEISPMKKTQEETAVTNRTFVMRDQE